MSESTPPPSNAMNVPPASLWVNLALDRSKASLCDCGCGQMVPEVHYESKVEAGDVESLVSLLAELALAPRRIMESLREKNKLTPEQFLTLTGQVNQRTLTLIAALGGKALSQPLTPSKQSAPEWVHNN